MVGRLCVCGVGEGEIEEFNIFSLNFAANLEVF
jgi:hypothetical protein